MGQRPIKDLFFFQGDVASCWHFRKLTLKRPVLPTHAEDELREALAQSQGQLMDLQVRMRGVGSEKPPREAGAGLIVGNFSIYNVA